MLNIDNDKYVTTHELQSGKDCTYLSKFIKDTTEAPADWKPCHRINTTSRNQRDEFMEARMCQRSPSSVAIRCTGMRSS